MDDLRNDSGHLPSKLMISFFSVASLGSLVYFYGFNDFYTKQSTDACNIFLSAIFHMGIVIGPAALVGIKSLGFKLYPSKYQYLF